MTERVELDKSAVLSMTIEEWREARNNGLQMSIRELGDAIILDGQWLTIGDAPSFMLSKKNAERLRDYVNLIEELQVGGAGGVGSGDPSHK